jgi:hypothetical protein
MSRSGEKYYNDKDWYKKEDWWKAAMAKEENKSKGMGGLEAIPTEDPLPRSKQIVMYKMIQVTDLLEKRTGELEERLYTAEVKIT